MASHPAHTPNPKPVAINKPTNNAREMRSLTGTPRSTHAVFASIWQPLIVAIAATAQTKISGRNGKATSNSNARRHHGRRRDCLSFVLIFWSIDSILYGQRRCAVGGSHVN